MAIFYIILMNPNFHIIPTMKSIKYILTISVLIFSAISEISACGPYYPADPKHILMFRSCSSELERQWQEGCRFQDYEKYENCILWQKLTSSSISSKDIEDVVYNSTLKDLKELSKGSLSENRFAQWLLSSKQKEDLDYLFIAKEIEDLREYMNDPWYYSYDGDEEHQRLDELLKRCQEYNGKRHADRYALQIIRLYFVKKEFLNCIDLWESSVCNMPRNIVTDMIASYVGGAYTRCGSRDKAIELFTRSQDIGSLISLKAWNNSEDKTTYKDSRVKELEYIFNRFPNSPLLSVKLQEYVRYRESFVHNYEEWADRDFHDPVYIKTYWVGDSLVADDEHEFYDELKQFAKRASVSPDCQQKGMWQYALAYLYHLDNDNLSSLKWLSNAEQSKNTPFIKESIKAFRFLLDAHYANSSAPYHAKLLNDIQWLDKCMLRDAKLDAENNWQYSNRMNWTFYYWQDVARKVILGELCPQIKKLGNTTLALQLANYATNRVYQIEPLYETYHFGWNDNEDSESYSVIMTIDKYRNTWSGSNWFDYCNQFFGWINGVSAAEAAKYAENIISPKTELDKFLNERSYVDTDYIDEIVGTLYLREMNYDKAAEWLAKVSKGYQDRTNIAKEGYFKLDPFRYQFDKKHFITDSEDYKLRFAQEMSRLEKMISSDVEPNRKANAKIRYAIGLRNSFGKCWYLTEYGYGLRYESGTDYRHWRWFTSSDREGFKENAFAQKAYKKVDALIEQALTEFTDSEQVAQAQLEMMNFATLMKQYPSSKAATQIRGRCDNYYDYALQER